jgi:signal transduction histidine kinase
MIHSLFSRLPHSRRLVGLQSRFMLYFGVIVVSLMTMVVLVVEKRLSSTMLLQTQMRGVAIANSIAAVGKNALLSYDYVSLQQAAETATGDEGVVYVIILNKENVVAGYSRRPERQGAVLTDRVSAAVTRAGGSLIQRLLPDPQNGIRSPYLDIAVPVRVDGTPVQWGTVRVGLSLDLLSATLAETRLALVLLGSGAVLIVLISARFLSRRITKPIERLAEATAQVATGELDQSVDEELLGELGDLARSFNKMTNDLKRSRDAINYQKQHLERMVQLRTAALEEKALELEAANAELKELDRLKSDFLSNVSHELRTPLTSIRSFTEIMLDQGAELSEGERREFLAIVAGQAGRLTRLISDLLDLSKMEAGEFHCQMVPMRLQSTAEHCIETLRGLASDKNVLLVNEIGAELPSILADVDRLNQVLTNLVDNAIKFTPSGGTITISGQTSRKRCLMIGVTGQHLPPTGAFAGVETSMPETGEYLVVSVRDTGVGIRAEDQQRIFDKFGQVGNILTDKPQGTGLGLPISGSIVVQHDGALWVESSPGEGSVFSFSIPVAQQARLARRDRAGPGADRERQADPRGGRRAVDRHGADRAAAAARLSHRRLSERQPGGGEGARAGAGRHHSGHHDAGDQRLRRAAAAEERSEHGEDPRDRAVGSRRQAEGLRAGRRGIRPQAVREGSAARQRAGARLTAVEPASKRSSG